MEKISVVVPCYNEEDVLELFNVEMEKLRKELKNVTLEVIYINDGSADNTLNILRELAKFEEKKSSIQKEYDTIISKLWEEYELTKREADAYL